MGLKRSQLARFVEPGQVMGHITAEAAALTGFPEGCPVVACAGDKQCEVLGSGSISDGQAYITLGTLSGLDIVGEKIYPRCLQKAEAPHLSGVCSRYMACRGGNIKGVLAGVMV